MWPRVCVGLGVGDQEKAVSWGGEVRVWNEEREMETRLEDIFQNAL